MARPSLFTHRKFRKLYRLLGSEALAVGSLELMWNVGYADGDPRLGESADVELAAKWDGEPGELTRCLLEVGFIDLADDGQTFAIHELYDHAPEYVRKRMDREDERKRKGLSLRAIRSEAGRRGAEALWQTSGKRLASVMANGTTPAPAPAPAPKEQEQLPLVISALKRDRTKATDSEWLQVFERFWSKYPRKVHKRAAIKAWMKLKPATQDRILSKAQGVAVILADRIRSEWRGRSMDTIPHASTFLNAEQFEEVDID